ncbi:hypothetical protein [Limnohabitans parvus]|uniref:hypothetical protein n=1 Tax=Limnohabitans parvus TaxID=540061 RepID=UPI0011B1CE8A|nr:hypothetical protein [Limnohabitans parvus]
MSLSVLKKHQMPSFLSVSVLFDLSVALGIGLLIGAERERQQPEQSIDGRAGGWQGLCDAVFARPVHPHCGGLAQFAGGECAVFR